MDWSAFSHSAPQWYKDAKLGIFIHWGAYSVPAWATPTGELGAVDDAVWFANNPYAEWYFNTYRIEGSPTRKHHLETYGDIDYDEFLEMWKAEKFQPSDWASLFAHAGARYVVPTTKHHDGITLWDAPGTGTRNTVHRGPKRDLIADLAQATREAGMRFGVYYSGGLDWSVSNLPPIQSHEDVRGLRPSDAAYSMYAFEHCMDLIRRHKPDVLWNDIEWPDFSKSGDENIDYSLAQLFSKYYEMVPEGVVDDRWGDTHRDFITSEYQMNIENESADVVWENCRGVGLSFGYNQVETEEHYLSPAGAIAHFVDIVSRGGNFLLNVGPTAAGEIPELQARVLRGMGDWMAHHSEAIYATRPAEGTSPQDGVRFTQTPDAIYAIVDGAGDVSLALDSALVDDSSASQLSGGAVSVERSGSTVSMSVTPPVDGLPSVVRFQRA